MNKKKKKKKQRKNEIGFDESITAIKDVFCDYSIMDVACSLFVSHVWLPNISCNIKQLLLASIFTSIESRLYATTNNILTYHDFSRFMNRIIGLVPQFSEMEDWIPKCDWGEIKYYCCDQIYKILYGQELSLPYEQLYLYEMVLCEHDEEICKETKRSPKNELKYCLHIQNEIIENIEGQPSRKECERVAKGNFELPNRQFWERASYFYKNFELSRECDNSFLENNSISLGECLVDNHDINNFIEKAYNGKMLCNMFVKNNGHYYMINPRRFISVLFDTWSEIYIKLRCIYYIKSSINHQLYRFISTRVRTNSLLHSVSAVYHTMKIHDLVFSTAFISKNRLLLFYVALSNDESIEEGLRNLKHKLNEAHSLLMSSPQLLALHSNKEIIEILPLHDGVLVPEIVIVIPSFTTSFQSIRFPPGLNMKYMFLHELLGIIDEFSNPDTFSDYLEFVENINDNFTTTFYNKIDLYGAFCDSSGVLSDGAIEFDSIMLDPQWGHNYRFNSLSMFWELYPNQNYKGHPRHWEVSNDENQRVCLKSKVTKEITLFIQIGTTNIFITSPFNQMEFEQCVIAYAFIGCIHTLFDDFKEEISNSGLLSKQLRLDVNVLLSTLIATETEFKDYQKQIDNSNQWKAFIFIQNSITCNIDFAINVSQNKELFGSCVDRRHEIEMFICLLSSLRNTVNMERWNYLEDAIKYKITDKPKFTQIQEDIQVAFPVYVNAYKPKNKDYKLSNKKTAQILKEIDVKPGRYEFESAKLVLNNIRDSLIREINYQVSRFSFNASIVYLIERHDALMNEYNREQQKIHAIIDRNMEFDVEQYANTSDRTYLSLCKSYRYLIEKYVQMQSDSTIQLSKEMFQYQIALVDKLIEIYYASDCIQYFINPVAITVDNEYRINIHYPDDMDSKNQIYHKEQVVDKFKIEYKEHNFDNYIPKFNDFQTELDKAFIKDCKFTYTNMINILSILTNYPAFTNNSVRNTHYIVNSTTLINTCNSILTKTTQIEIRYILEFLTLRTQALHVLITAQEICNDLPIWEHRKRCNRYSLRPLISINNSYLWGPYSTLGAITAWSNNITYGYLPTDMNSIHINTVLELQKRNVENALENIANDIVSKFTEYCVKNCELNKKNSKHPQELGDYDVISYFPQSHTIIILECKDNFPPYCLKDAKRLREKIFGRNDTTRGHIEKVERRHKYIVENANIVIDTLRWPKCNESSKLRTISIYLTRQTHWWTRFPPYTINIEFLRFDQLSSYIYNIIHKG